LKNDISYSYIIENKTRVPHRIHIKIHILVQISREINPSERFMPLKDVKIELVPRDRWLNVY